MKRLLTFLFCAAAVVSAADYFPLEPGNSWTYRHAGGRDTFTIRIGLQQAVIADQVYHRLDGYTPEPLWVRMHDEGLYYRDEERNSDLPLTPFVPGPGWYDAPFRPCPEQLARAVENKEAFSGPIGRFGPALQVEYRIISCADVGVTREDFLDNIGMVRREITTFAGPRVYELVSARVGGITVAERPFTAFRVSAQQVDQARVDVALRLSIAGTEVKLVFPSSQEYDAQLRDAAGNVLYTWSADKLFLEALHEKTLSGEVLYTLEMPLSRPLEPGTYTVEAWITAGPAGRAFSATTTFQVAEVTPQ